MLAAVRIYLAWDFFRIGLGQGDIIRLAWLGCMILTVALALLESPWAIVTWAGWILIEFGSTLFGLYPLYPLSSNDLGWKQTLILICFAAYIGVTQSKLARQ